MNEENKEADIDFSEFEKNDTQPGSTGQAQPQVVEEPEKEFDINDLSDRAPSEKHIRVSLIDQVIKLKSVLLVPAKLSDPIVENLNKNATAIKRKVKFVVYYDTPNDDRENIQGVIQFENDGKLSSPTINPEGKSQATHLLRVVAGALNKVGKDVSIKEFYTFLKSKCGTYVRIVGMDAVWEGKTTVKNMIGEFDVPAPATPEVPPAPATPAPATPAPATPEVPPAPTTPEVPPAPATPPPAPQ